MRADFDLAAFRAALEAARAARGIAWSEVARETGVSAATLRAVAPGRTLEADGALQLLRWLGVEAEAFVGPGGSADAKPVVRRDGGMHRADLAALHSALDAHRQAQGWSWSTLAAELGVPAPQLTRLEQGGRISLELLVRVAGYLGCPVASFVRVAER